MNIFQKAVKRYLIDAMGAMAQGLFASLLIGTILNELGKVLIRLTGSAFFDFFVQTGKFAMDGAVVGAAMAVAIGWALGAKGLVLFSLATVGSVCNKLGGAGGPLSVLVIAIVAAEAGNLVAGRTKVDIILTPLVTILLGVFLASFLAAPIGRLAMSVGQVIQWATAQHPFVMGVVIAVVTGCALTLPISSAALCSAFAVTGLAGGAALAGCCANMVGFAVISARENTPGDFISQSLGTSMLQMPNIVKNIRIWVPAIIASAVGGPLATCLFKLRMDGEAICSGMGTCGLVGPIGVLTGWAKKGVTPGAWEVLGLVSVVLLVPAIVSMAVYTPMRKLGWIKVGDLRLGEVSVEGEQKV